MFKLFTIGRRKKTKLYTDLVIELYEKQMAAREALGTKYICHPFNDSPRLRPYSRDLTTIYYQGYEAIRVPPEEVLTDATHYQNGTPILRVVK